MYIYYSKNTIHLKNSDSYLLLTIRNQLGEGRKGCAILATFLKILQQAEIAKISANFNREKPR